MPLPFTYKGSYYKMRNRCTIITRIRTSEGIVGEAYNADEDEPLQSEILSILHDELVPAVIGLDAFGTERVWEAMLPATFDQLRPRWYAMQAMACIDTAVWDAVGKAMGQPLWRIWGGYRDRIPMIGIGGYYIPDDETSKGQEIEREIDFFQSEHGMVGMKFKIGAEPPAVDAARLARARRHAGDDFLFVVDANQGYTVPEALEFVGGRPRRGHRHPLVRGADPLARRLPRPARRAHARQRRRRGRPERDQPGRDARDDGRGRHRRLQLRRVLGRRPDRVAARSPRWPRRSTSSSGHHEEAQVASHLLASQPHGTFVEAFSPARDPIFWQMIENRPALVDGQFPLPDRPGLGWVLDEAFIERYRVDR